MRGCIIAHRRSGTHLLAKLLHRNLVTGCNDYEDLHGSHTVVPEHPYISVWRPALPTMVSMWRMRQRWGIHPSVTFRDMMLRPFSELPRHSEGSTAVFRNGELHIAQAHFEYDGYLLDKWLHDTRRFAFRARVVVAMRACIEMPSLVLRRIAEAMYAKFQNVDPVLVTETVGWQPCIVEHPDISWTLLRHIEKYDNQLTDRCFTQEVWSQ